MPHATEMQKAASQRNLFAAAFLDASQHSATETTATYTGLSFGAEDDNRYIVFASAGVAASGSNTATVSATAGGVSATKVVEIAAGDFVVTIWIAAVPTGTTGTIVVVYNQSQQENALAWARMINPRSATADDSGSSSANPGTDTLTGLTKGGYVFAFAAGNASPSAIDWSNLTERDDSTSSTWRFSCADIILTATSQGISVSYTDETQRAAAWAAWH